MVDDKESQLLESAAAVFLRYGFRRTTMGDLAGVAGLSRPALYLRYPCKEKLFEAAFRRFGEQILARIREGVSGFDTPLEQLRFAFELWVVQPFLLLAASPDAKDLADCSLTFARENVDAAYLAFETELRAILERAPSRSGDPDLAPGPMAHLLATSARGLKHSARTEAELRRLIEGILKVVLAAMG